MPAEAHRYLVQALVLAGSSGEGSSLRDRYWNQVGINNTMLLKVMLFVCLPLTSLQLSYMMFQFLHSLYTRFSNVCQQPNFINVAQDEEVKCEIQSLLESFRGVALASSTHNTKELFHFILPVLHDSVTLLNIYQDCPEVSVLVLEMYVDVVQSQIAFLSLVRYLSYITFCAYFQLLMFCDKS